MKTAIQELILKLPNDFIFDNPIIILDALIKEKEQIIDAWKSGNKYLPYENPNEYYNQTYKPETI